jgi:hypothetical protein
LANIAFAFGTLPWLPNPMTNHFNFMTDGTPARFEPPLINAVAISFLVGFITITISVMERALKSSIFFLELIGVSAMIFILFFQWLMFLANQTIPPKVNSDAFWHGYIIFVVFFSITSVCLFLSFCLPKEKSEE